MALIGGSKAGLEGRRIAMKQDCQPDRSTPDAPTPRTIPVWWRGCVEAFGDKVAVRRNGVGRTYADLERESARLARGLVASGVGKGTRIGLLMPNGAAWITSWLAISKVGAIAVNLSTFFAAGELAYGLAHADVAVLLTAQGFLAHDFLDRLEDGLPSLARAEPGQPLSLPECPYLRTVWVDGAANRAWTRGTLEDLARQGDALKGADALLAAIERAVSPADLGLMIYTSGSTADPKCIVHTQGAAVSKTLFLADCRAIVPYKTDETSRPLILAPFFWVGGFLSLTVGLTQGSTLICTDDRSPKALLTTIRDEHVTHVSGSDALLRSLKSSPEFRPGDFDRLKPHNVMQLGYFNIDPAIASDRFPNSLGMTETFGPHSGEPGAELLPEGFGLSFGRALPGMDRKIVDPQTGASLPPGEAGELCVRGDWLMQGFYKRDRSETFHADGFYRTGDHCSIEPGGALRFHGRLGGMIKTSGANVSPEEVEEALRRQPGVIEAAVFGLDDPKAGQTVIAVVAGEGTEAALKASLKRELSSFKVPKRILFMDRADLPLTPGNKIRKVVLAAAVAERLGREAQGAP